MNGKEGGGDWIGVLYMTMVSTGQPSFTASANSVTKRSPTEVPYRNNIRREGGGRGREEEGGMS